MDEGAGEKSLTGLLATCYHHGKRTTNAPREEMMKRSLWIACLAALLPWVSSAHAQDKGAPPKATQEKGLPITVELGDVSLTKLPFVLAAENGLYTRNGLDVTQFITPSAAAAVVKDGVIVPPQFIKSGIVGDINIGGGSPTMVRMTSSAIAPERIILATTDNVSRFHIVGRADIKTPEDLKGKRLGYGSLGALDHFSMALFVRKMGWNPDRDVQWFANGNGPQFVANGRVDAFGGTDITLIGAKKMGLHDIVDLGKYKFKMPGSGVNAMRDWLPKNRETAARFMKATVEAIALLKTDKQSTFAAMAKWYNLTDPAQQEAVYAQAKLLPSKPYPSVEGLKNMISIYHWRAMAMHPPEYFYDASFVTQLDKSGYIDGLYKNMGASH